MKIPALDERCACLLMQSRPLMLRVCILNVAFVSCHLLNGLKAKMKVELCTCHTLQTTVCIILWNEMFYHLFADKNIESSKM